ncbi:MAG TPA: substrate-binding domain-containing protein [Pseudonocardiaceae bacterium]|nr:substrate-binding domain-containing protein [Pseudonocardiaceae bacterium]
MRYQGFRDALADHGLSERPELVSEPPEYWLPESAAEAVTRMIDAGTVPDGIVGANDGFAVAALSALSETGLQVPEDVSVVGFDDFTNIRNHNLGFDAGGPETGAVHRAVNLTAGSPSLTTVHSPFREMGRRAVQTVLAMIRGDPVPAVVSVPTELVVRRLCGCLPTAAQPDGQELAQTLTMSDGLPADWPDRLSSAFVGEMRGQEPHAFLGLLDRTLQTSLRAGEDVENWWRVLYMLRNEIARPATPEERARAEDLVLHAQLLINETTTRYARYARVLTEKRSQIVREVGQRLITASDVDELASTLAEELPKVGIPGCYLAAYEPSKERSRLLLAHENGTTREGLPEVFDSVLLVPDNRLHRSSPYSMVVLSLSFRAQKLGFVLLELGPAIGWIYASLQESISSALHRAFLVERESAALAAVEEAHRREERHRLAGELHDSVSQALFSMTLQTRAIELAVERGGGDTSGRVARGLRELRGLTQGALAEMRSLIFQLRPAALHEEGLVSAMRRQAAAVASRESFGVFIEAPEERLPLSDQAEQELFRIAQEALHNCVKHARPDRVDIRFRTLDDQPRTLVMEIVDDGVGFDPDVTRPGHVGLDTMRERTERLSGELSIESIRGGLTTVRVGCGYSMTSSGSNRHGSGT